MALKSSHFRKYCVRCGTIVAQCKCPVREKTRLIVPASECPKCVRHDRKNT